MVMNTIRGTLLVTYLLNLLWIVSLKIKYKEVQNVKFYWANQFTLRKLDWEQLYYQCRSCKLQIYHQTTDKQHLREYNLRTKKKLFFRQLVCFVWYDQWSFNHHAGHIPSCSSMLMGKTQALGKYFCKN